MTTLFHSLEYAFSSPCQEQSCSARTMALDPKIHNIFLVTAEFSPPPALTPENPRPRPTIVPDSFVVLVFGR